MERPALASLAVRFGATRLIDNEILDTATGTTEDERCRWERAARVAAPTGAALPAVPG